MRAGLVAVAMSLVGCSGAASFLCADDPQCGGEGQCEASGFCSFPDPRCESGRRYGEYAAKLASTCVPGDDDSAFDSEAAPQTSGATVAGSGSDDGPGDPTEADGDVGGSTSEGDSGGPMSEDASGDTSSPTTGDGGCDPVVIDDFEDGVIGPVWQRFGEDEVAFDEGNGELRFALPTVADRFGGIEWVETLDLRDGYVSIELGPPEIVAGQEGILVVRTIDGAEARLRVQDGVLHRSVEGPGTSISTSGAFDVRRRAHLRIRLEAGILVWESSPDGQNFDPLGTTPFPFDPSSVAVLLVAGTFASAALDGSFVVRNLEACLAPG